MNTSTLDTKKAVQDSYGLIAETVNSDNKATSVAEAFGYNREELNQLPEGANMGLSCGNPLAMASLRPGEVVVDLGSGGGIDCFLASKKVGPTGKVIGLDMTPAMIRKARANALKGGYTNVEFRLGEIEDMPIEKEFADCIISNCVLNLVPNKQRAYNECFRILKPGGRFAISDIAFKKSLPEPLASNVKYWTGCIAGAQRVDEMLEQLKIAGFTQIEVVDSHADLNVYKSNSGAPCCSDSSTTACGAPSTKTSASCCQPSQQKTSSSCCSSASACAIELPGAENLDLNEYAMSVKVFARKPK